MSGVGGCLIYFADNGSRVRTESDDFLPIATLTELTVLLAGFGTQYKGRPDWSRVWVLAQTIQKTAGRENPNRWAGKLSNRAHGTERQNRSCSITCAAKEKNSSRGRSFFT